MNTEDILKLDMLNTDFDEIDFNNMTLKQLGLFQKVLREKLDEFSSNKSNLQKKFDFLTITIVPERMDEEGIDSIKLTDIGRLQTQADLRCSVPAKNKEALNEWLVENGHESMITTTINSSTLKAFVREQIREGKPWPQEILKVEPYSRSTIVKA